MKVHRLGYIATDEGGRLYFDSECQTDHDPLTTSVKVCYNISNTIYLFSTKIVVFNFLIIFLFQHFLKIFFNIRFIFLKKNSL